ncbi:PMCA-type calcium-translocating P-type ATPase [Cokeromyces recurvatus]|uniref:PMCA-type calcium-translocating P-type ATPase n=1 Tax=Cokeromyces recurvatus TaxID=90255 RepID=UPI00221F5F9E|nr:PMCA-type calcium-translocating P-type ATPase [Cokeromyces recurvatus]KAI7898533.1 PMCA-type calcium-translocating P-type ATPase [Cokeromyces recurvatus]
MSSTINDVKVDMRDTLTTPHSDPLNPFAFQSNQLAALQDPKNIELLHIFGGLKGVAKGLHTDLEKGLTQKEKEDDDALNKSPITLYDITLDSSKLNTTTPPPTPIQHEHASTTEDTTQSIRTTIFGSNVLPPVKSKNIFQLMWLAFQDKTLILLAVAAIVSLAVGLYEDIAVPEYDAQGNRIAGVKWVEGVAIIVAILIVVLVGSVNDFQKERQFRKLNAKKKIALRDGQTVQISVYNIQVGDILYLEPGDIVAADGIFIEGHNVRCDESAATGESDAVRKQTFESCYFHQQQQQQQPKEIKIDNFLSVPTTKAEASSMNSFISSDEYKPSPKADPFIISGSKVLEGVCTYLVTGVGVHSYYGRTMMALRTENESTPLQEKLNNLASMIAKLGSAAGLLMLIVLFIRYFVNWKYDGIPTVATEIVQQVMGILIVVVTIIVVAVPEGLPLAVTLALAYATQRMLKDNNLVRVLAACETMGNATTVCSDKTGTLTQNKMTVVAGTLGSSFRFLHDAPTERVDLNDISTLSSRVPLPILHLLNQGIAVNSTAFETEQEGVLQFVGNKTETALLQLSKLHTKSEAYDDLRKKWPQLQVFPFSSERKAMATVIRLEDERVVRVHVKGASEILVQQCQRIVTLSKTTDDVLKSRPLTEEDRHRLDRIIQSYASRSLRTIALAYRDLDDWDIKKKKAEGEGEEIPYEDIIKGGLTLIGIVGIEDPLRPGVKEAVKACQRAGVFVRMVTGDNAVTAKSIAKQCGIYTAGGIVMEGPVFRSLAPHEMDAILPRLQVLARSSPEDKQILVGRLRELGDIVAVTGDGTNDGPALKLADVGFSMGIAGTEVAKEASSIILMDDNFSSIVKAIMWGRCVNDSVKKFLEFQITVNITAVVLTFISSVVSHDQKSVLTAVQLLWVNLIMDTFAALALATDPPTKELLERSPEPRSAPLITFKMWKMIIGQAIFQIVVTTILLYSDVLHYEANDPILQTIVFNTFVFCQIFNEINCRRIDSHLNIFSNILANKFFIFIFALCVALQVIIVNVGGAAFQVTRVNGVAWAISIVVGLLSIPIGAVIRLIPDELFAWVFLFSPNAKKRYLGGQDQANTSSPSVYVAGNERIIWNQPGGHTTTTTTTTKAEEEKVEEAAPAYDTPNTNNTHNTNKSFNDYVPAYEGFEEQNQDTILSSGSLEQRIQS